jgi:hypothetical protein
MQCRLGRHLQAFHLIINLDETGVGTRNEIASSHANEFTRNAELVRHVLAKMHARPKRGNRCEVMEKQSILDDLAVRTPRPFHHPTSALAQTEQQVPLSF